MRNDEDDPFYEGCMIRLDQERMFQDHRARRAVTLGRSPFVEAFLDSGEDGRMGDRLQAAPRLRVREDPFSQGGAVEGSVRKQDRGSELPADSG